MIGVYLIYMCIGVHDGHDVCHVHPQPYTREDCIKEVRYSNLHSPSAAKFYCTFHGAPIVE